MTCNLTAWLRRALGWIAVLAFVVLAPAQPAFAHTDFDFSLPTDGAVVGDPVTEIRIGFTLPVTLVGNGFEVLDPQGEIRQPFAVTDDDTLFRLQMDPPLAGGDVGVRWEVRAADGHVLSGSFSFTVDSPPPTTAPPTTAPPVTTAPPTTAVATSPPSTSTAVVDVPETTVVSADATSTSAPAHDAMEMATASSEPVSSSVPPDSGDDDHTDVYTAGVASLVLGLGAFAYLRRERFT